MAFLHHLRNFTATQLLVAPHYQYLKNKLVPFCNTDRVFFVAIGKNLPILQYVSEVANSFGLEWRTLNAVHLLHGDSGILKFNDRLVFVSKSGETTEVIQAARHLPNASLCITSKKNSSLSKECSEEVVIPINDEGSPFGYAPMASCEILLLIMNAVLCR